MLKYTVFERNIMGQWNASDELETHTASVVQLALPASEMPTSLLTRFYHNHLPKILLN